MRLNKVIKILVERIVPKPYKKSIKIIHIGGPLSISLGYPSSKKKIKEESVVEISLLIWEGKDDSF